MKRKDFITIFGLGAGGFLTPCTSFGQLDLSAAGEGTGVQILGAVLAVYKATAKQKQTARERAAKKYVEAALRPAYEAQKRKVASQPGNSVPGPDAKPSGSKPSQTLAKEIAALDKAYSSLVKEVYGGNISVPAAVGVNQGSLEKARKRLLSDASTRVPVKLVVSVPEQGTSEEARRAEAQNADSVMVYNTRRFDVVNDDVYVMRSVPTVGGTIKGRGQYIGEGVN